jgi:hypothetical protein
MSLGNILYTIDLECNIEGEKRRRDNSRRKIYEPKKQTYLCMKEERNR